MTRFFHIAPLASAVEKHSGSELYKNPLFRAPDQASLSQLVCVLPVAAAPAAAREEEEGGRGVLSHPLIITNARGQRAHQPQKRYPPLQLIQEILAFGRCCVLSARGSE